MNKRTVTGKVVSKKTAKTIVVQVDRRTQDSRYKKFITRSKKYMAHDEQNLANEGDTVCLVESRPMSKLKRWALKEIIRKNEELKVLISDQK